MAKQQIEIPHTLPVAEVKARLEGAQGSIERKYGAACSWQSPSELRVRRTGFDGVLRIEPERLRIEIELGFLLRAVKSQILGGITRELTGLLAAAPSSSSPPPSSSPP